MAPLLLQKKTDIRQNDPAAPQADMQHSGKCGCPPVIFYQTNAKMDVDNL